MAWDITATKAGNVTAKTAQTYVDRDITVSIPAGEASVTGKTITSNPTISWDANEKKIKAEVTGSEFVYGSVAKQGWVDDVGAGVVSVEGSAEADTSILPAASGSITMTAGSGSLTGSNCTLATSNTSGVSVTGKGTVSAVAKTTEGFTAANDSYASGSKTSSSRTRYITGVTIGAGKAFDINDGINSWHWAVDANGNVNIT